MNNGYTKDVKTKESSKPETERPTTSNCIYLRKDGMCGEAFYCCHKVNGVCTLGKKL